MTKTVYHVLFQFPDGSSHYSGDYRTRREAELRVEHAKEHRARYGNPRRVSVMERTFTPGAQSMNACMLTIAR